jgi:hypothetical protein
MTTQAPHQSAQNVRELTIDLHLRRAREIFIVDDFDPFVPGALAQSGVERIKAAALEMKMPDKINVSLYLPADELKDDTARSIREALKRYCAYQDRQVEASIAALKREAISELRVGGVVLAIVVALAVLLSPILTSEGPFVSALGALVGGALVIALWVVVWAPIETFFIEPLPLVWERRFYRRLPDADLVLRPEPGEVDRSDEQ